jgi:hypothetical protein
MDMRTELRRPTDSPLEATTRVALEAGNESSQSSISWSAVIAGAVVSAALALVLLILCVGLKLTTVSPWVANTSGTMLGVTTIVAAVLVQLIASSIGGYVAGRLRTKWVQVHDDEVYFRDTAHGFIVWALATVVTAGFLTSAASTAVGSTAAVGTLAAATGMTSGMAANGAAATAPGVAAGSPGVAMPSTTNTNTPAPANPGNDTPGTDTSTPSTAPAARVAPAPMTLSPQAMERARSVAAQSALWTFLALLVGAFAASLAATIGGRQRDRLAVALRGA